MRTKRAQNIREADASLRSKDGTTGNDCEVIVAPSKARIRYVSEASRARPCEARDASSRSEIGTTGNDCEAIVAPYFKNFIYSRFIT